MPSIGCRKIAWSSAARRMPRLGISIARFPYILLTITMNLCHRRNPLTKGTIHAGSSWLEYPDLQSLRPPDVSRVHSLTAFPHARPHGSSATGLLELCRQLWSAQDASAIERFAAELVERLLPGTQVRILDPEEAARSPHQDNAERLLLQNGGAIETCPRPTSEDH